MATEQPSVDPILAMAEAARQSFAHSNRRATVPETPDIAGAERKVDLSKIAKATFEQLNKMAGGLTFIATHPAMWPGIAWSGAKGWGENMIHPLNVAKQVIIDKKPLTKDELFWVAGAIEGAVETFVVYNSLPPGLARLTRAGASLAFSQAPLLISYVREIREKGEAAKDGATAEEIKDIEQRHTRAAGFIKSFSKGRAAGGAVRMFTAFGALEIIGEKGFEAVLGADQMAAGATFNADKVMSGTDFIQARDAFFDNPKIIDSTQEINVQTAEDVLQANGVGNKYLTDTAFVQQVHTGIGFKTNEWINEQFAQGAKEALIADPTKDATKAAEDGQQHVRDALAKLYADQKAYDQFISDRKGIVDQAIQEADARKAAVTPVQEAAAQQIMQTDEISKLVETSVNDFTNTRMGHKAVRLITTNIAKANGFDNWDQVPAGAAKKTLAVLESQLRETYEKEFKKGVVEALAKNPNDVGAALKAGEDKLYDSIGPYIDLPDPPFAAGEELTPDVQKFVEDIDSAFRENLTIDRIIAARPDFQAAKAAAVGARLGIIDQEYTQVFKEAGVDTEKIPTQTLGVIKQRFQSEFQHSMEAKANEYFDAQADKTIRGGQPFEQAAVLGSKQFLGDLDNTVSELRKTLHKEALETLVEVTKAEGKASLVGANLVQIDQATDQAIDKLGISGEISAQTRQAIKTSIQHRAEELVNKSFNQVVDAHNGQAAAVTDLLVDTKERFENNLPGELTKVAVRDAAEQYVNAEYLASIHAHQAEVEKAAKDAITKALADRATTHAVVSSDTYADVQESARYIVRYQAKQILDPKIAAVNLDDPDPAHLHAAIKQAVAEGKKGLDNQLHTVDPKAGWKGLSSSAEVALNEHFSRDQGIRSQISQAVEGSQDHITTHEIKSGQTVSHLLVAAKQPLDYTPHDARKLASFIAINEKELADMHYAFEQTGALTKDGYFPVTLDSLYDIMVKAENGDPEAMRKLKEAVWWIQKGHTLKVIGASDQERIINILKSGKK